MSNSVNGLFNPGPRVSFCNLFLFILQEKSIPYYYCVMLDFIRRDVDKRISVNSVFSVHYSHKNLFLGRNAINSRFLDI